MVHHYAESYNANCTRPMLIDHQASPNIFRIVTAATFIHSRGCLTQAPGPTEEPWSNDPGGLTVLNHTKLIINSTHLLSTVFSFRQSQVKFAAYNTSYYFLKSLRILENLTSKRIAQLFWKFLIPVVLQIREDRTLSMDEWCFELTPRYVTLREFVTV